MLIKIFYLLIALIPVISFGQPTLIPLEKCGVSVTFSGMPIDVTREAQVNSSDLGVMSAWGHSSVFFGKVTQERALCFCPNEPSLSRLRSEINITSRWNKEVIGVGRAAQSPIIDGDACKDCSMTQILNPKSSTNCFVMQELVSEEGLQKLRDAAVRFFDATKRLPQ